MGVKIAELLKAKDITFSDLAGSFIAVDAPNILFSLLNFSAKNTDNLFLDRTQRVINHLYGLLFRVHFYYSKKIFPVFCFDGRVSELKRLVTKDQINDYLFTKKLYENAMASGDKETAKQIAMSKEHLWPNVIEESKKLLGLLGVPYMESPASAESQCAHLVKNKFVDYMNSQDFDSLIFGSPNLIQNLSKSLKRKVKNKWIYQKIVPKLYYLDLNLAHMNINHFQLVDLVLMLKTDYFKGIHNIGPITALKLILEHGDIETIIRKEYKNHDFSFLTPKIIKDIRKIYLFPHVIEPKKAFEWSVPIKYGVLHFLCEDHHLNRERVEKNLTKLMESHKKCVKTFNMVRKKRNQTQLTLDSSF